MPRPAEPAGAFSSIEETMSQAKTTYRAVEATGPGKLRLTERTLVDPPAGHARIRVEACGVCHSDSGTVDGLFPIQWPRVPGHEAVGRIDALGAGVEGWAIGQRVGVGFLGGSCGRALASVGPAAACVVLCCGAMGAMCGLGWVGADEAIFYVFGGILIFD